MTEPRQPVRVQVLGAIRAWRGSELALGGPKQRAVLAILALSAGRPISRDAMIDFVWTGEDPSRAAAALHTYVAALRRALGPASSLSDSAIQSVSGGYQLNLGVVDLDLARFRRLVDKGRTAVELGAVADAAAYFADAIALRQGPLVDGLRGAVRMHPGVVALEQEYLGAALDCADIQLRQGRPADTLGWLPRIARSEPLNEPLQTRLIRAFHAAGRQAEALAVFEHARAALRDDLGVDPGDELGRAHADVLRRERPVSARDATPERWLGRRPDPLPPIGRDEDIEQLCGLVPDRRIVTLVGPGGVGKTTLALAVAQRVAGQFPDGVAVVECGRIPADAAADALDDLVTAAVWHTLDADRLGRESRLAAIARQLSGRRHLLVIDNAEHVAEPCARLIDHLTRSCPSLRVMITSRRQLGLATETVWDVRPLALPAVDEADTDRIRNNPAVQLLLRFASQLRAGAGANPGEPALDTVAQVCRRLGGLPLAIELAGARLRGISVADLARSLEDRSANLRSPTNHRLPHQQAVESTFAWSERLLQPAERLLLGRLAVFAGGFGPDAARKVCGEPPIAADDVLDLLGRLVDQSVLQAQHLDGVVSYAMLPPIREFAAERADPFDLATIRRRHLKWCTEQVRAADFGTTRDGRAYARHVLDDVQAALAWALSSAQPDLVDAAATLLVESRPVLEHSPASLDPAWKFTQLALRSGDVLSGPAHGRLRHLAGRLVYLLGRTHEVRPHLEVARALLSTVDDPDDRARLADIDVGLISAMEALLDPACLTAAEAAIGSAEGHVDKGVLAFMFADLANVFSEWGRTGEAYAMLHRAQQLDDLDPVSSPLITRAVSIPVHDGDPRHALDAGLPILAQSEKTAPNALIEVFVYCGWAYAGLGDFAAARQHIDRGIELARSTRPIHEGYAQLAAADTERLAGRSAAQRRSLRACLRFGLISFDLRSAVRAVWLSALMAEECRSEYAARLAAASLVIRELTGLPAWPLEEPVFQRWRDAVPAPGEAGPDRHNTIIHSIELALEFIED